MTFSKSFSCVALAGILFSVNTVNAEDLGERAMREARETAKAYAEKGFHFDPEDWTVREMHRYVARHVEAAKWAAEGVEFDPETVPVLVMRQRGNEILTARLVAAYWKLKGFNFNPDEMSAAAMDQAAREAGQDDEREPVAAFVVPSGGSDFWNGYPRIRQTNDRRSRAGQRNNGATRAAPSGAGGVPGGGQRGRGGAGGQVPGGFQNPGLQNRTPGSRGGGGGGGLQIPPGIEDINEFLEFIQSFA
ncbi:MAG: hypothetical protein AAGG48_16410 [Planctomycetota bacterium]